MKTLELIDILIKVANDDIPPERIKYCDINYKWTGLNYYSKENDCCLDEHIALEDLRYPVEIIEEDKDIEKLESYISFGWGGTCKDLDRVVLFNDFEKMGNKINELIDEVNKLKGKSD